MPRERLLKTIQMKSRFPSKIQFGRIVRSVNQAVFGFDQHIAAIVRMERLWTLPFNFVASWQKRSEAQGGFNYGFWLKVSASYRAQFGNFVFTIWIRTVTSSDLVQLTRKPLTIERAFHVDWNSLTVQLWLNYWCWINIADCWYILLACSA